MLNGGREVIMLWALVGCGVGLTVFPTESDTGGLLVRPGTSGSEEDGGVDTGMEAPIEDDSEPDLDGDGYGSDDCDDTNPNVHPGQFDGCDGIDNDCDGESDEDAIWDETPSSNVFSLGPVEPYQDSVVTGLLAPINDKDSIEFYLTDGLFGWFYIDAFTTALPAETDVILRLYRVDEDSGVLYGPLVEIDEAGIGEHESLGYAGTAWYDDSGLYRVDIIAKSGSNCEIPYEVHIDVGR